MEPNGKQNQTDIASRESILNIYKNLLYSEDFHNELIDNPIGYDIFIYEARYDRINDFNTISKLVHNEGTEEKQRLTIKSILSEIDLYTTRIEDSKVIMKQYPLFLTILKSFKEDVVLKYAYLLEETIYKVNPKIWWLGDIKLLTTLIYDLWKGQKKGKIERNSTKTPPLIKSDHKSYLEKLLLENFLDSNGNPLSRHTISDYLNENKDTTRLKEGSRIELDIPR